MSDIQTAIEEYIDERICEMIADADIDYKVESAIEYLDLSTAIEDEIAARISVLEERLQGLDSHSSFSFEELMDCLDNGDNMLRFLRAISEGLGDMITNHNRLMHGNSEKMELLNEAREELAEMKKSISLASGNSPQDQGGCSR